MKSYLSAFSACAAWLAYSLALHAQPPAGPSLVAPMNAPRANPETGPEPQVESASPIRSVLLAPQPPGALPAAEPLPPPEELLPAPPASEAPGPSLSAPDLPGLQAAPGAELAVSHELQAWLTQFVLRNIPHEYEDKRQWGKTTQVWDGLHVTNDGLLIKTKRRKKEVNDGTWKMYRADLLNPEHEFQVRLENLHDAGRQRAGFDLVVTARVHAFGRLTQYLKGVQLVSLSANADATLELRMHCLLGLRLDPRRFPPDVLLLPEVTEAELTLTRFHLQDVSDLGGALARELGYGVRQMLEDKLLEERRRLPERINRQLDKNREKLRISLADLAQSEWSELASFLPRGDLRRLEIRSSRQSAAP